MLGIAKLVGQVLKSGKGKGGNKSSSKDKVENHEDSCSRARKPVDGRLYTNGCKEDWKYRLRGELEEVTTETSGSKCCKCRFL